MIDLITTGRFKNYREICHYLNEPIKTGKSKQLQDWKRFFGYRRDGNAFEIQKVYDEPKEKTCRTSNNIKNIRLMIDYIQAKLDLDDNDYYSMTDWYCDKLALMYKSFCNVPYMGSDIIEDVCERESICDDKLFCKYISLAKSELKNMFLKALDYMQKKNMCIYEDGYMFTYQLGKRSLGHISTNVLNDIIKENETIICNDLNREYNFSDKLSGRQNLLVIYRNETYKKYFDELKISMLMDNKMLSEN